MREIKFRAWDERGEDSYGQAVTPKYIYDIQNTYDDENGYSFEEVLATPKLILEQFTGLHDKNGKEIYEGDIPDGYGAVFFSNEYLGYFAKSNEFECEYKPIYDIPIIEIIGNIHENPELLESPC